MMHSSHHHRQNRQEFGLRDIIDSPPDSPLGGIDGGAQAIQIATSSSSLPLGTTASGMNFMTATNTKSFSASQQQQQQQQRINSTRIHANNNNNNVNNEINNSNYYNQNTTSTTTGTTSSGNNNNTSSSEGLSHRPGGTPKQRRHPYEKDVLMTSVSPSTAAGGGSPSHQQNRTKNNINNVGAAVSSTSRGIRLVAEEEQQRRLIDEDESNVEEVPAGVGRYSQQYQAPIPKHGRHSYLENYHEHPNMSTVSALTSSGSNNQKPRAASAGGATMIPANSRKAAVQQAAMNLSAILDNDLVSSINTSQGGDLQFAQEFRQALSKAYFKIDAQDKTIVDLRETLEKERRIFSERMDSRVNEHANQVQAMEAEHKADRTFLVQAKHDRDRFDRQYHDLLELAERREQEQQLEMNRWENERQSLSRRVEETASGAKNMSQLLEAAQSRVRALEEQLADRDHRLQQLQKECAATRTEVVGFEKKVREGLLVDARISQKWLSEADNAKRDNQALCASLLRAMNLISRTVEYGQLVTRGALGEGFVYCGADPNVNFGSTAIASATSSAGVLSSLVSDTNALLRSASQAPLATTATQGSFPSIFDAHAGNPGSTSSNTHLRADLLRTESDFWVPKAAYDLLGRLLGWMEQSCALKITPAVEQQLLPALHEWFIVLNAVWRERTEQKVRAGVQQHNQRLERDAEKRRSQSQSNPSRFSDDLGQIDDQQLLRQQQQQPKALSGNSNASNNNNKQLSSGCNPSNSSSSCAPIHPWEVSIPSRRTSDRLRTRIDEAKRLSWNKHQTSSLTTAPASSSANTGNNNNSNALLLQKWASIAVDALQSTLDLEKTLSAQQREGEKQRLSVVAAKAEASDALRLANQTSRNYIDGRDIEDALRRAAGPVSVLQDLSEQLREHVEDFKDALTAANPDTIVVSSTSNTEHDDDGDDRQHQQPSKNNRSTAAAVSSSRRHQQQQHQGSEKVPLQLLAAVFNVASQFCGEVDKSTIHLQKAQFDIDKTMTGLASLVMMASSNQSSKNGSMQEDEKSMVTDEEYDEI